MISKQNKLLVPELRFPEFSGEWEEKKLKDITKKIGSGSTPRGGEKVYQEVGVPFIRSKNVFNNKLDLEDLTFIPEDVNYQMRNSSIQGLDVLLNITGASIGRSCVVPSNFKIGNVNQHVCIIRTNGSFNPYFLQPFLSSHRGQKLIYEGQTGSGREGLNFQSIATFKLNLPLKPEQQKIASFLTTVDNKIEQLTKKKGLLKKYKKGVMQKIFNQEIRFKDDDGSEYSEWEEKRLGEVFSFYNTNSFSRALLNYEEGDVKNIHYGDIHTKFKTNFNIKNEKVPFVNSDVNIKNIKDDQYCKVGDLVIADASEDYKDIGKVIEIINLDNQKLLAGLHTYIARNNTNEIALGFPRYLMKTFEVRLQVMKLATGVSVLGISKSNLSKVEISLPSKSEQQKIASFLIEVDSKIEQAIDQLKKSIEFKKGLLQRMFI